MSEPPAQDTPDTGETPTSPDRLWPRAFRAPDSSDSDLEDMLRRRMPVRIRVAQTLALLIAIAVAAGLVVHSVSLVGPSRTQAGRATPPPVPLAPVLFPSNVPHPT